MIQSHRLAGLFQTVAQPVENKFRPARPGKADFGAAFREVQLDPARTCRAGAGNVAPATPAPSTPGPGTVVVSPFNPLGFPISATPAPTAAEVEANPDRWRGTSFDPALRIHA